MSEADRICVVDGASTDSSVAIVQSAQNGDARISLISEPDSGIYDAWNKAIKINECEWISFIGCGDLLRRDFRDKMLCEVSGASKHNLIHCYARYTARDGDRFALHGRIGAPLNPKQFRHRMKLSQAGALHHKSLFESTLFSTNYKCNGDYEFLLIKLNQLKAHFVAEELVLMDAWGISSRSLYLFWEEISMKRALNLPQLWKTYLILVPRTTKRLWVIFFGIVSGRLSLGRRYSMEELLSNQTQEQ